MNNQLITQQTLDLLGISERLIDQIPELPDDITAMLIYGSQARGDATATSDLDLLALVPEQRPSLHCGDISISFYTNSQLETGIGTLFGTHLKRDSKILWDPDGTLMIIISKMGDLDTGRLFQRATSMSTIFTTRNYDLPKYLEGLSKHARYLLRSCLYTQAIANGQPCFSVREIASRHGDPELVNLLASRQSDDPNIGTYNECLNRLKVLIGDFPDNPHGSLEATIVNEWTNPGDILSAAFLALGTTGQGTVYAEVRKILL